MEQMVSIGSQQRAVTLTPSAVTKVRELIAAEDHDDVVLRMGVRPGGCSGFSYEMFFDREVDADDIVESFDDVQVVVDPQSVELIRGAQLDYTEGLQGAGFAISNPNVTRSCGCGNSFS
ncbi:MAG: iron-sulfur cluster insertion protein ErpA [Acidimicrobiia bacterium]